MAATARGIAAEGEGNREQELAAWHKDVRLQALEHLARKPAPPPSRLRIGAFVLILLLHALLLIGLSLAMHQRVDSVSAPVRVRLIVESPEPPLPVPPVHTPRIVQALPRAAPTPSPATAATRTVNTPEPEVPRPQLFNPDGSIRLPATPAPAAPTAEQVSTELMQRGHNIVHCRKSRFAGGYARDETAGNKIARKYLVWIGLYNAAYAEAKAAQREAEHAAACDD